MQKSDSLLRQPHNTMCHKNRDETGDCANHVAPREAQRMLAETPVKTKDATQGVIRITPCVTNLKDSPDGWFGVTMPGAPQRYHSITILCGNIPLTHRP